MFGRIHTAALTMPLFILGGVAAGGSFWSTQTLYWALFGVLFHFNGMMVNNLLDLPYDRKDPEKQHFPLVAGRISESSAWALLLLGHGAGLTSIFLLSLGTNAWAIGLLFVMLGWLYNVECKEHPVRAPLWNSLTTTLIPVFSFYSTSSELNMAGVLLFLYVFLLATFQIGYEGSLKDINSDEENLVKLLGARVEDGMFIPRYSLPTGVAIRAGMLVTALLIVQATGGGIPALVFAGVLGALMVSLAYRLLRPQKWDHRRLLKRLGVNEIIMYFTLLASFTPLLGFGTVGFLAAAMLFWFMAWNRFYWGTWLTPVV